MTCWSYLPVRNFIFVRVSGILEQGRGQAGRKAEGDKDHHISLQSETENGNGQIRREWETAGFRVVSTSACILHLSYAWLPYLV